MKTIWILFLITLALTPLVAQKENNKKNHKAYYDFTITIDIKEQLSTDDQKFIINPSVKRNYFVLYNYKYESRPSLQIDGGRLSRIPIDSVEYLMTFNQLDTILNLTKKLFNIDYYPNKHDQQKFYPPKIYDGAIPIVSLEITNGDIFQIELSDQDNINYTRLLNYILKIKNTP